MIDISILVVSCDKNIEMVQIFFEFFEKFWDDCPYDIFLSMEEKKADLNEKIIQINDNCKTGWCGRVQKCLEMIPSKYVLIMLDDFFIEENVNMPLLDEYVEYMEQRNAAQITLTPIRNELDESGSKNKHLVLRNRWGHYKTCLQCGIWNRKDFISLLKEKESPWEFELFGNIRSFICNKEFYAVISNADKPIKYNDGFLAVQGKINLPEKRRLEKKTGIDIPLENMPSFDSDMVRDRIKFVPRVIRRLRIIVYYWLYRCKYIVKMEWRKSN